MDAQVAEMREWFKAFYNQNHTVRDYRKYFKTHMVYLEGAWQLGKSGDKIDGPFESDRHRIDANSWFDLQEKVNKNKQPNQYTSVQCQNNGKINAVKTCV